MYFAEHRYLGNCVHLPSHDSANPSDQTAKQNPLTLSNGLVATYGDINGFAGDYFGLINPISAEPGSTEQKAKFQRWFDLLALEPHGKPKAEALLNALKPLNDKADASIAAGKPGELATVYKDNPLDIWMLDEVSNDIKWPCGAGFMELLKTNVDHFGPEARIVYNVGHTLALEHAAKGDLQKAYAINAFADHFLEDSFAAGHMRVPRRRVMALSKLDPLLADLINAASNVMHEEDGELGLWAISPSGERWQSFGDGRLPEHSPSPTTTALKQCQKSLSVSVQEVHDAFTSTQIIPASRFGAWEHAPIIDSISKQPENHQPLLKTEGDVILRRTGGAKSETYEATSGLVAWASFYAENFSRVEGQVTLVVKKYAPWLF